MIEMKLFALAYVGGCCGMFGLHHNQASGKFDNSCDIRNNLCPQYFSLLRVKHFPATNNDSLLSAV